MRHADPAVGACAQLLHLSALARFHNRGVGGPAVRLSSRALSDRWRRAVTGLIVRSGARITWLRSPASHVVRLKPRAWIAVDWIVAGYTVAVAVLILVCARSIPEWPILVGLHGLVLVILCLLPPRGAPWEQRRAGEAPWRAVPMRVARFLRYTYPALLLTPFFEEVRFTVNAVSPATPYWFEPYLYAVDRALFGTLPAIWLSQASSRLLDELMHALYFSYYPLIIGGIVIAWRGPRQTGEARRDTPDPGFRAVMTSMMLGFVLAYVWYPFLPARGPWENSELMSGLPEFRGMVFTPIVQWIIDRAAVSGGCFPSAHVAGTWGLVVGLAATHRRTALWFGLFAAGMSVACVYTRYHHAVDVPAGLIVGCLGGMLGRTLAQAPWAP